VILVADKPIRGEFTRLVQQPAGTVLSTLVHGEPLGLLVDEAGEPVGGISFQGELALAMADRLQGGEGASPPRVRCRRSRTACSRAAFHRLARLLDERCALAPLRSAGSIAPRASAGSRSAAGCSRRRRSGSNWGAARPPATC